MEDFEKSVEQTRKLGGTVEETKHGDWGAAAFCADPFGNGFCIIKITES